MDDTSTFTGPGLRAGIELARAIRLGGSDDIREAMTILLFEVVSFMGIVAVVVLVIAGVMLTVHGGSEDTRIRVRNIITYTVVGLLIILTAGQFVSFVIGLTGL